MLSATYMVELMQVCVCVCVCVCVHVSLQMKPADEMQQLPII